MEFEFGANLSGSSFGPGLTSLDERDGPENSGWWFGTEVGGNQVRARHAALSLLPPKEGWTVPYNGEVHTGFHVKVLL